MHSYKPLRYDASRASSSTEVGAQRPVRIGAGARDGPGPGPRGHDGAAAAAAAGGQRRGPASSCPANGDGACRS